MTDACSERDTHISMLLSDELSARTRRELEEHLTHCRRCRDHLRDLQEDHLLLRKFADEMTPIVKRIEANMCNRIIRDRTRAQEPSVSMSKTFVNRRLIGLSLAASIVGMIVILVLITEPQSLYAQMNEALEKVRTVHAVGKTMRNGRWETVYEVWWKRGVGLLMQQNQKGKNQILIDDGERQWKYTSGDDFAIESKNRNTHPMKELTEALNLDEFRQALSNEPTGRVVINGVECQVYEWSNPEQTYRAIVYIDEKNLARRYEDFSRTDGQDWVVRELCDFDYDVEIDDARFAPEFGPNVSIIRPDAAVEKKFDLKTAIYTKEVVGLFFAVHEFRRGENGFVYLVCSTRPTEETIRQFGVVEDHGSKHGDFTMMSSWERMENHEIRTYNIPVTLASGCWKGIYVGWHVLVPRCSWPENRSQCPISMSIHSRGSLAENFRKQGLPFYRKFNPLVTLHLPDDELSLSTIIANVHAETLSLEPVMTELNLDLGSEPEPMDEPGPIGEKVYRGIMSKPSRISKDEFERKCRERFESLNRP